MKEEREKGILVGLLLSGEDENRFRSSFHEMRLLADTAGVTIVEELIQRRPKPDPSTYIGKGKMEEIRQKIAENHADVAIFHDSLTPVQIRNLESEFGIKIVDRTQLILDIFALRARTRESQLQVELAQLQYLLPRLTGRGQELSRLGGGIGTRGPGETKLETDRRRIRLRIAELKRELTEVAKHRELHRQRRRKTGVPQIILTGYTNAGKSTLLNRLTQAEVLEENRLFATLDPTARRLVLPSGIPVVVIDTVGFIQNLPTHLVAAFRSTLEVVKEADLILHVIDSSDPEHLRQMEVVENVLRELGAIEIPRIRVFNKRDLAGRVGLQPDLEQDDLWISAHRPEDVHRLLLKLEQQIVKAYQPLSLTIPFANPKAKAKVYQLGHILREDADEEGWHLEGLFPRHADLRKIIADGENDVRILETW